MERVVTSLSMIFIGDGLLALSRGFWRDGELPAGSFVFKQYHPSREGNPLAFHFFLAPYVGSGGILLIRGVLALLGLAPALPCTDSFPTNGACHE